MGKRVVILGGGTGGLVVANHLRQALSRDNDILLVDREKNHLFNPSLLWLMVGWRTREQIQKPLSRLQRKGIRILNALVQEIDFERRRLVTSEGDVPFDYLVIAPGASTFPEKTPGFPEAVCNLYDLSGAEKIREAIKDFDKGRLVILIASTPFKCPAAPYEAALLLSAYFAKKRREVEIEVVTPEASPMGVAGPEIGDRVVSLLQSRGIRFTPQHQVAEVDPARREIAFPDGKTLSYELLLGVPFHGAPPLLQNSPVLGESGWVKVNPRTLETEQENIYALGDATGIPLPVGKPLPKAGVFAHFQADVVAYNIKAKIEGMAAKKEFDGRGYCFIELGEGRAGYASGNFYAEPKPVVKMRNPSRLWHWEKVLLEKWWLWKWF
jgi:sulfide:quinone oxidoreductase